MAKTNIEDIDRNIYDIKNKDNYEFKMQKGLNKEIVEEISKKKNEPEWMRDIRLKALETYNQLELPTWGPDLSELKMDEIATYVKPKTNLNSNWNDVPEDIRNTFDKLGIPEAEKKSANSGSEKDYKAAHDDLEGEGVADKTPKGGKSVKMNESFEDAAVAEPMDDLSNSDFEEEPAEDPIGDLTAEPVADGGVEEPTAVGDDLVGIDDEPNDEEDLDSLLREFDEEFGSMDEPEEVSEESAIVGPNKVLDGPHGTDGKDAKWERVEERDGNVNAPAKEGGEASLNGPHGSLGVQSWDKMDKSVNEAFQFLSKQIYKNLKEEVDIKKNKAKQINEAFGNTIERIIKEELTKLDAWGKHPRYQQAPFKTPASAFLKLDIISTSLN